MITLSTTGIGENGRLVGPCDLFADPAFDRSREIADQAVDCLRQHGPFEPNRLNLEDLEYTTMRQLEDRVINRWNPMTDTPLPMSQ